MGVCHLAGDPQWVAAIGPDQKGYLYPVAGGEPRLIPGLNPGEQPITFSSDSHSLYVYQPGELPASVTRLDLQSGKRSLWKQLMPSDPAGVETIGPNPDDARRQNLRVRVPSHARRFVSGRGIEVNRWTVVACGSTSGRIRE